MSSVSPPLGSICFNGENEKIKIGFGLSSLYAHKCHLKLPKFLNNAFVSYQENVKAVCVCVCVCVCMCVHVIQDSLEDHALDSWSPAITLERT